MNWIALIGAGLCEVAFTFCMGRLKGVSGWEFYSWLLGFLCCMSLSMYLLIKAIQTIPIGTAYPIWTGIGAGRDGLVGHSFLSRAGYVLASFLYLHPGDFRSRTENGMRVWKTERRTGQYEKRACNTIVAGAFANLS